MLKKSLITSMLITAALLTATSGTASKVQLGPGSPARGPQRRSAAGVAYGQPGWGGGDVRRATIELNTSSADAPGELREEFHQTYPLSANGRVSVENLNGGVKIAVWDRNEVQVDAVKRAYKQERLNEAKIEVSASSEAIRIKTNYPDWDQSFTDDTRGRLNNPAIVDYSITVPRKARLESIDLINGSLDVDGVEGDVKASSINGRLVARGLLGVAKLSTVNGSLEATFVSLDEARPIYLNSVNGSVVLVLPSDANAIVRAETVHGGISNDFGLNTHHGEYVGHELYGQLGTGGPRIKLGNVNGRIAIKHAQDGRTLSPATSLVSEKEKDKDKDKGKAYGVGDEQRAEEVDAARITRETQAEVQREVERSIREAQREITAAQREIQRETQRRTREEVRREARGEGRGTGVGEGRGRGDRYNRYIERESKSFAVNGAPNVNVATFDGSIRVHGWDKSEVMYAAEKRATDAQEVKQITIQTEQQGSTISIIAKSIEGGDGVASLDVYVPRNATLHVSSGDGSLHLDGVSGDLNLRTGDGSIEVSEGHGQLQVNTGDGSIKVTNFEGNVDARTGDGSISLDGKFSDLAARTGDGSISLSVPANSDFTIETDAEDIDNAGLTISEDVVTSKRVRRWKVGRGGKVFVLSTGDGRIALNSR